MFRESAELWDVCSQHLDYSGAAERLTEIIEARLPEARTILDVGCGTARHIERLQHYYEVVGVDLSPQMLAVARGRCPNVRFYSGDMRTIHLDKEFDVVSLLFSALSYLTDFDEVKAAARNLSRMVRRGGLMIAEPYLTPDQFWPRHLEVQTLRDGDRAITRMHCHKRHGHVSIFDMHYLVGTPENVVHIVEREELGLYYPAQYVEALELAGFTVEHLANMAMFGNTSRYGLFIGTKI